MAHTNAFVKHGEETMAAFWLRPAAAERAFFIPLIERLARECDAPVFAPHVTVFAGRMHAGRALEILHLLPFTPSLRLEVHGVAFSSEFTKTVFVQFRPSAEANALGAALAAAARTGDGYRFDPHLSLIYRTMEPAKQKEVAGAIEIPFRSVTFDSLQVISCPSEIARREDVESWRTLGERPLTRKSGRA